MRETIEIIDNGDGEVIADMTETTAAAPSGQPLGIAHRPSPCRRLFADYKAQDKPAFIGYLPFGFPDPDLSLEAFRTMVDNGTDIVEIGLPYSDPVMDGPVIQAASQIAEKWGKKVANRCPQITEMKVSNDAPAEGASFTASVSAKDPDGDMLTWMWTVVDEASFYGEAGLGLAMPEGWDESIVAGQGTPKVTVKLPGGGNYRLYAYCFDGKGNAAYANWPVVGKGPKPKKVVKPVKVPYAIYADGVASKFYASGWMGNMGAMKTDDNRQSRERDVQRKM